MFDDIFPLTQGTLMLTSTCKITYKWYLLSRGKSHDGSTRQINTVLAMSSAGVFDVGRPRNINYTLCLNCRLTIR